MLFRPPFGIFSSILLLLFLTANLHAASSQTGQVVYQLNVASKTIQDIPLPINAKWVPQGPQGQACFKIHIQPKDRQTLNAIRIPIDLTPYRGMVLLMTCNAKADNVSKPKQSWNGIKCMLNYKTPSTNEHWTNQGNVYGTFDWKQLSSTIHIPDDATAGTLYLGMQDCDGTAWISDVKFTAVRNKPIRPKLPPNPSPAYKGHNLPRLRGVMSPQQFREADFAQLEKWNANVVRWQITRNWGKSNTELDLAEYDQWIDAELDDLDKAAQSAKQHGIMLMIDLHSPPGGRLDDRTLRMVMEKKYQDHFIKVWQRIATRFKDNPAIWAYDLINEPVQNQLSPTGIADWLGIQILAAKAIRKIDPDTAISIEVDGWDAPSNFTWLAPVDIPNVIYQVHMYWPGQFTHQGVHNDWGVADGDPRVEYPSTLNNAPLNKEALRKQLKPVRKFQQQCNAHIFVGEFSAIRWAPGAEKYLADCISIFEEYGWDWTYHAFREWPGWSVEHESKPASRNKHVRAQTTTKRAQVLLNWFAKNKHRTTH